jgi:hypothetical protein
MIIVVGGMYRSGSTFTFNVVRECLLNRGGVTAQATNAVAPHFLADSEGHLIIKSHAPDEACTRMILSGAVRCVCTYRKPEDAIASYMRAFQYGLDQAIDLVRAWIVWHQRVSGHCLNLRYADVDRRPLRCVLRLQRWLFDRVNFWEAVRIRRTYDKMGLKTKYDLLERDATVQDIGFSYYDQTTYFHRRHISSIESMTGAELLDAGQLARIRQALGSFVDVQGQYRPS